MHSPSNRNIEESLYREVHTPKAGNFDDGAVEEDDLNTNHEDGNLGWFHAKIKLDKTIHWANNFRLQLIMALMFAGAIVITVIFADSRAASVGLLAGGSLSILTCSAVIYTYMKRYSWRRHPNPFIFYRSVCDLLLVVVLLVTHVYTCVNGECREALDNDGCTVAAGFTQFFLFASESWFFVMAIDMWQSLRSPFTDYKRNIKMYHWFVWGTALVTALILVSVEGAAGQSEFGYCWTERAVKPAAADEDKTNGFWDLNIRSWAFFYIWLLFYWIYAISIVILAWKRLNAGLNETLRMRLRVLHSVTLYVIAIIIYWGLSFVVYAPYLILEIPECEAEGCYPALSQLMSFMITCKGYFDFVVWFQINELTYSDGLFRASGEKKNDVDVDIDLNPQVNLALRCEVLYYTTTGIIQAVKDTNHLPPGATQQALYLQPQGVDLSARDSLGVDDYLMSEQGVKMSHKKRGTLFIDYCPHTFRTIREHFNITTEQYIASISKTTKERLSEGASGAFMFFSHDQQFIVKSMSQEETAFLRSICADYAAYLLTHPDSLLTRFYGCHSIKLYGSTFSFVVMANLFSTEKVIHRRYDIKGSWVNRTASHPQNGKRVTCRHCNGGYIFGSTDAEANSCPMRVGKHEPNSILKDNDLTAKVRLDRITSEELYQQLVMDANFLARLGIMDYSLLLGVHNVEYMVDGIDDDKIHRTSTARTISASKRTAPERNMSRASDALEVELQHRDGGLPRIVAGTLKANTVVGPSCYYFGLIDILQTWNLNKRLERFAKLHVLRQDPDGISAVPPTIYKDRFTLKIADILGITLHNEEHNRYEAGLDSMRDSMMSEQIQSPYGGRYM